MNNIREAIRLLAKPAEQTVSLVCVVDKVDTTARTIDCTPIDDSAPLLAVNMQANQQSGFGLLLVPKVGSYVVVGFIDEGNAAVVLLTDELERVEVAIGETTALIDSGGVTLNGGSLGGLVKVEALTERLNLIERDINSLKDVFKAWTPVAQDGGAALKASVATWAGAKLTETERGDYENENVKQ